MGKPAWHASPYLLLTITAILWAGNLVLGRGLRHDVPPMALAFWRWAPPLAVLWLLFWRQVRAQWPLIRAHWKIFLVLGPFGSGLNSVLVFNSLARTTATNAALLNSFTPIFIILLSVLFMGQRLTRVQTLGVFVSLIGVLCIVVHADFTALDTLRLNLGDFYMLGALLTWSIYTICLKWRPAELDLWTFMTCMISVGLVSAVPFYIWELVQGARMHLTFSVVLGMGYLGVCSAFVATLFWNRSVAKVGPTKAGMFVHLIPVFGSMLSVLFLGESLHAYHVLGIGLVFVGLYLTNRHA